MSALIFDIETGPLPDEQLKAFLPPFVPPKHPGEFDPASVKIGNLKDEAKIAAKVEEARAAHAQALADYTITVLQAETDHWLDFVSKAALSPVTGRILAIGYHSTEKQKTAIDGHDGLDESETRIIQAFWTQYVKSRKSNRKMVGCNILDFDLPFICRRSLILNVEIPATAFDGRFFDPLFVDVRKLWLFGQHSSSCSSSLDYIAKALGVGQKTEGITGGDFARLWFGDSDERAKAKAYLTNDLSMTTNVSLRLGAAT